jgi:NADPH2:quinone reductase
VVGNRGTNNQGTVEINPRIAMNRDAAILGMSLVNVSAQDLARIHAALVAGLANGTLRPIVGQEFALADAPRAHHVVIEANAYGKIVLIP